MEANINDILMYAKDYSQQIISKLAVDWKKSVQKDLLAFYKIFKDFVDQFENETYDRHKLLGIWQALASSLGDNLKWIQSVVLHKSDITLTQLTNEWLNAFNSHLNALPREAEIHLTEQYWQKQPADKFLIRIWKRQHRFVNRLKKLNLKIINGLRSILRKKQLPGRIYQRKFSLQEFLEMYLSLPACQFIYDEWLEVQKETAQLLNAYHYFSEATKDDFLFLEKFSSDLQKLESRDIVDQFQKLKIALQKIQSQLHEFSNPSHELDDRFEKYWQRNSQLMMMKWTYAGTLMFRDKKFDQKRIDKERNRLDSRFEKSKNAWQKHFHSEKREWQKDLELSILQLHVAEICIKTVIFAEQKIKQHIIPTYDAGISLVQLSLKRFYKLRPKKKAQLNSMILTENRSLVKKLQQDRLPEMVDSILKANIIADMENYANLIHQEYSGLSKEQVIFKHKDLAHKIPRSVVDTVPLKELVEHESLYHLNSRHQSLIKQIQTQQEKLLRNISEIDQIVEFNLDTALNLLQEDKSAQAIDQARQIAIEGLERTINQLNDLKAQSVDITVNLRTGLQQLTFEFELEIHDLIESEKIFALKLKRARAKTRQQVIARGLQIWQIIKNALPHVYSYLQRIYSILQIRLTRFRKFAGLTSKTISMEEALSTFLTETRKSVEALPFVYQRLFRLEPLIDERFYTIRKNESISLQQSLSNWKKGRFAASALVGEKGSGKTTVLNFFKKEYTDEFLFIDYKIDETIITQDELLEHMKRALDLRRAKSFEQLEQEILKNQEPKVLIFENLHNLFIRSVDGFSTLERFLLFLSRTDEKIHWIVTCSLYGWQYLDKVLNIAKYFSHIIEMKPLLETDIENIVLKRHRVSGYELEFEATPDIAQSRRFKKLHSHAEQIQFLQKIFFKQLNDLANGNVTVALLFWQRAIQKVTKEKIIVTPEIKLDHSFLFQLSTDELFTLAALIQHEILSHQQHARIFRQGEQSSELLLERMCNSGILVKKEKGYVIHLFLYRPIVVALKAKNILH